MTAAERLINDSILLDVSQFSNAIMRTGVERMLSAFARTAEDFNVVPFVIMPDDQIGILPIDYFSLCRKFFDRETTDFQMARQAYHPDCDNFDEYMLILKCCGHPIATIEASKATKLCRAILQWNYCFAAQDQDFYFWRLAEARNKIYFVGIDFLFWTNFESFYLKAREWIGHTRYLMLLRRSRNVSFPSDFVRRQFFERISRDWRGNCVVNYPGGDALGTAKFEKPAKQCNFVVVGTLEPRKYSVRILNVFQDLVASGHDVSVSFLGGLSPLLPEPDQLRFREIQNSSGRLRWINKPTDKMISDAVKAARALICISSGEGYAAPPVEASALGVPCITSGNLPCLEVLGDVSQYVIPHDDVNALRAAILFFCDYKKAASKGGQISSVRIPTWYEFASGVFKWCSGGGYERERIGKYKINYLELEMGEEFSLISDQGRHSLEQASIETVCQAGLAAIRSRVNAVSQEHYFLPFDKDDQADTEDQLRTRAIGHLVSQVEIQNRFDLHDAKLGLNPVEYIDWLGRYYLGRRLPHEEVMSYLGDQFSLKNPIDHIILFANCEEARQRNADPMLNEWVSFVKDWSVYAIALQGSSDRIDMESLGECYSALLGRNPNFDEWTAHINLGSSKKDTVRGFLLSDEHIARVKNITAYSWALGKVGLEFEGLASIVAEKRGRSSSPD